MRPSTSGANDGGSLAVIEQQVMEQPLGEVGAGHGLGEPLADQQRLRRVFEDDAVAGHQRRNDRIYGGQVRVIPWRNDQHCPQWITLNVPAQTADWRGFNRCQRFRRNGYHVPRTLFKTAQFARTKPYRATHLPSQLSHDVSLHR